MTHLSRILGAGMLGAMIAAATPASAQHGGNGVSYHDAVNAAILSDVSRDRDAEREAKRQPYATPGYGPIHTAKGARDACSSKALEQVGGHAKIIGVPLASTMSTGWEVEGKIDGGEDGSIPFVCSVRNGSVSGVLLQ